MSVAEEEKRGSFAVLVECDPGKSLGGSCLRDIRTMLAVCGIYKDEDTKTDFSKGDEVLIPKFLPRNCTVLTTSEVSKGFLPEGLNLGRSSTIISCLKELVDKNPKNLLILLTGHGYQRMDTSGDEKDRRDEYIKTDKGVIVDDELVKVLSMFSEETNIIALSDTCHSGTLFDFPLTLTGNMKKHSWNGKSDNKFNGVHLSACSDSQLSQCDVGDIAGFGGSLTVALAENRELFRQLIVNPTDLNIVILVQVLRSRLAMLRQTIVCQRS